MEALKANPEEVELLISTESIEKADIIIAPKDISRGVENGQTIMQQRHNFLI